MSATGLPRPLPVLLTPAEVAELFRVDAVTVSRWAAAGRIPGAVKLPLSGHWRLPHESITALLGGAR